ncbi:hypothetical protein [Gottfriedia acidiceleris]|uniref:hypothetical protein n=1 Tax=Gottfriedia acidiceleris TaxID=371036 RepID=UPI003000AE7A
MQTNVENLQMNGGLQIKSVNLQLKLPILQIKLTNLQLKSAYLQIKLKITYTRKGISTELLDHRG